jgi:thiol:disulfide interchange protein
MSRTLFALTAIAAVSVAGAAQACSQCGEEYAPASAYFSYRDMSDEQRIIADEQAKAAQRGDLMESARTNLLARFAIKVDPEAGTRTAQDEPRSQASQVALAAQQ